MKKEANQKKGTILIVDDEPLIRMTLESGLMENQKDGTFHPEKWMSKLAALRVLDQAQKMG